MHRVSEIMLHNSQWYLLCFRKYLKFVQKSVLCLFVSHVTLRKVLPSSVVQLERIQFTHTMECNRSIKLCNCMGARLLSVVHSLKAFVVESIISSYILYGYIRDGSRVLLRAKGGEYWQVSHKRRGKIPFHIQIMLHYINTYRVLHNWRWKGKLGVCFERNSALHPIDVVLLYLLFLHQNV